MYKLLFIILFSALSLWASGSVRSYSLPDVIHCGNTVLVVTPVLNQQQLAVSIPYRDTNGMEQLYESEIFYSEYKVEQVLALDTRSRWHDSVSYISSDDLRRLPNSEAAFLTHTIRVITQRTVINTSVAVRHEIDRVRKFPIYYSPEQELLPKEGDSSFILICSPNYRYNSFETVGLISIEQLDAAKKFLRSSKYGTRLKLLF